MIVIFNSSSVYNETADTWTRTAYTWIRNGGATAYMHTKGGLSNEGDLQTILNATEATLYAEAQENGLLPTPKESAKADRLIWLAANPNAKAIFTLSSAALETEINNTIDAVIPLATAANRTKMKRLLMGLALVSRESLAGE